MQVRSCCPVVYSIPLMDRASLLQAANLECFWLRVCGMGRSVEEESRCLPSGYSIDMLAHDPSSSADAHGESAARATAEWSVEFDGPLTSWPRGCRQGRLCSSGGTCSCWASASSACHTWSGTSENTYFFNMKRHMSTWSAYHSIC